MSIKLGTSIIVISLLLCCKPNITNTNQFSSNSDTLFVKTKKIKGQGLMQNYPLPFNLEDSIQVPIEKIPLNITNPQLVTSIIDYKVYWYNNLLNSKHKYLKKFLKDYYPNKIDTSHIPLKEENRLHVLYGEKEGEKIFILDENNNHNFRDDSIRVCKKINFDKSTKPIKLKYNLYNGKNVASDSGWVYIGINDADKLSYSIGHHISSKFTIDEENFEIEVVNSLPFLRFGFENPKMALTTKNGKKKDSIKLSEMLEFGEYLKLGQNYYLFSDISNNGSKVTLIKEEDVSNKIGNQVGFIAPNFEGITTKGDSIELDNYSGKKLLLVNVSSCWSEPMSYDVLKKIQDAYLDKIDMLVIDESPVILETNIESLGLSGNFIISTNNKSLKENYREDFCSRICFLIDENGRIQDKFEIFDWESSLKNIR